jgi:FtsH-binding integral membrane protein
MYVPNYVPDPVEVPDNVTQEKYRDRLAFIRRVSALHILSLLGVLAVVIAPLPRFEPAPALIYLAVFLLGLELLRILFRGRKADVISAVSLLPPLLAVTGIAADSVLAAGFPVWSAPIGVCCAVIYAMLCGRDFSFVGQYLLSLIVSSAIIAFVVVFGASGPQQAARALAWNAIFLIYYVYDLASLLARRRKGEELAAVVDLHRDALNLFGWTARVITHWRQHKIWTLPAKWS